ncbi:uncharacterized protein LOC126783636 [Argentina anserina]|uniref:uncharacterized protein LOC126783636 n=1 Tax=Argentina anserina TaxID=57926 RepID=UPI00217635A0|nr:uncharacterized protein LOC126783636 [Potentilla anserina]
MNTKTMRLPPRRISTTIASSNNHANKRKERESSLDAPHNPAKTLKLSPGPPAYQADPVSAVASGQLLAGYLAHEFLTKGTLLGQLWDPTARSADEPPPVAKSPDRREEGEAERQYEKLERYVEVADLLKTDGAQLAGIVNPTQLARFLQL